MNERVSGMDDERFRNEDYDGEWVYGAEFYESSNY